METIIFLCSGEAPYHNKDLPERIKDFFLKYEEPYKTQWSCGNSKFIKVGSRAYFKRSGNIGSNEPIGFIAAGHIIAAPKDYQLRLVDKGKYSELSEAYTDDYDGCFAVYIQIDSVVDFELPLEQRYLKQLDQFKGVNFNFGGSGCRFNEKASPLLDAEWEKYSLEKHRQKRGLRLVDIFIDQGDNLKQKKEYQAAIEAYKSALEIEPKYAKAINRINNCESILKRLETKPIQVIEPKPPIEPPDKSNLIAAIEELDEENFLHLKVM